MTKKIKSFTIKYWVIVVILYIISIVPDFFVGDIERTLSRTVGFVIATLLFYFWILLGIKLKIW